MSRRKYEIQPPALAKNPFNVLRDRVGVLDLEVIAFFKRGYALHDDAKCEVNINANYVGICGPLTFRIVLYCSSTNVSEVKKNQIKLYSRNIIKQCRYCA